MGETDNGIPFSGSEPTLKRLTGNVSLDKPIDKTGVEAVPGTYGADRLDRSDRIFTPETIRSKYLERFSPVCADEIPTSGLYLFLIDLSGVFHPEQGSEILVASPHDIRKRKILPEGVPDIPEILDMGGTEIDIVIENRSGRLRIFKEPLDLGTTGGIKGIE